MSYTTTYLIEDDNHGSYTECPCCGEYLMIDEIELKSYHDNLSVPIECYECSTIFYLEKEEN